MYERFTDRSRKVMKLANEEAMRFGHEYIGTEHILLGLVKEGSGVAANVLRNLGIDLRKVRIEVEKLVHSGSDMVTMSKLPQTPRAKKVIEYSMEEARNLGHNYVGTEHILLGLLRDQEGVAATVLLNLGLHIEEIRREIENLLGKSQSPGESNAEKVDLPKVCPKCGQPVVRVIWHRVRLLEKDLEDVAAGRAILGSSVGTVGPEWACLQCAPKWSEVHRLAVEEQELQVEKENAIAAKQFEKAAQSNDRQMEVRQQLMRLLSEILAGDERFIRQCQVKPPHACSKCGHSRLVRVIWGGYCLSDKDLEEIKSGQTLLGSVAGDKKGPPWACLECAPKWSEVHDLAMQDYELQLEKAKAIESQDFEKAARCLRSQEKLRSQLAVLYEELSKDK
jgi:hypothetical protein